LVDEMGTVIYEGETTDVAATIARHAAREMRGELGPWRGLQVTSEGMTTVEAQALETSRILEAWDAGAPLENRALSMSPEWPVGTPSGVVPTFSYLNPNIYSWSL
jgi:hypothetical protein